MSKVPRPIVPSSVMADTAADPYPTARWVNVRAAAMLRYADLAGWKPRAWNRRALTLTRNASEPVPVPVHSQGKTVTIWPRPALGAPAQPLRSTMRRVGSASLRGPDHSIADDHVPAVPPPRERWPKTGPHVSDDYPAGRQQPVVFPRVAVDNMEGSRVAVTRTRRSDLSPSGKFAQ